MGLGSLAVAGLVLAACVIVPRWRLPALQIVHNDPVTAFDDFEPDMAVYNNIRYVVWSGDSVNGDTELFIQGFNLAGQAVTGQVQVTDNLYNDYNPRLVSGDNGFLYLVEEYQNNGDDLNIWWWKLQASDLTTVAGPTQVSIAAGQIGTGRDDDHVQVVHAPNVSGAPATLVVWESEVPTNTVYYNRVLENGVVSTPIAVSQGTGCAPAVDHQFAPQLGRSYPSGTYAFIAWYGFNSGIDSVFWRSIDNELVSAATNCVLVSGPTASGDDARVVMDVNPGNNISVIAWDKFFSASSEYDVFYSAVTLSGTLCQFMNVSNADTTTDDFTPDIAAGHAISNWVHLGWEHNPLSGGFDMYYGLLEQPVCGNAPTFVSSPGTILGAPFPAGANPSVIRMDVRSNVTIGLGTVVPMMITSDQVNQLVERQLLTPEQADALLADGQITSEEVAQVVNQWAQARTVAPAVNAAAEAENPEAVNTPAAPPDCAAQSSNDWCLMLAQPLMPRDPVSPEAPEALCGTLASDAVLIGYHDGTNSDLYTTYFQAVESDAGGSCADGAFLQPSTLMVRADSATYSDFSDFTLMLDAQGLGYMAWPGQVPAGATPSNWEIFLSYTTYPVSLPLQRR